MHAAYGPCQVLRALWPRRLRSQSGGGWYELQLLQAAKCWLRQPQFQLLAATRSSLGPLGESAASLMNLAVPCHQSRRLRPPGDPIRWMAFLRRSCWLASVSNATTLTSSSSYLRCWRRRRKRKRNETILEEGGWFGKVKCVLPLLFVAAGACVAINLTGAMMHGAERSTSAHARLKAKWRGHRKINCFFAPDSASPWTN